ncbi:hypothetical protein SYNPS1DRAFT_30543 [Syncephalis pseudoplumigaleata]|uniref:Uncharacterized protein n=1 Tax=Syncephalis pseudoplumigaleata TaxID=1712513 RepID=A0A4P9YW61_9FUNG|nr:hypothetical protein SYNPS1DRAFT_30543 [Syncephalis pseudoplumigaleata]|eukprot:RKP23702.1 hypothetical protein SYNPS1DRAFT_30543 [Syncephalis pseudoplumigaleata]
MTKRDRPNDKQATGPLFTGAIAEDATRQSCHAGMSRSTGLTVAARHAQCAMDTGAETARVSQHAIAVLTTVAMSSAIDQAASMTDKTSLGAGVAAIPDEIWLRIFILCNENIVWYIGYASRYPAWSRYVEYADTAAYDWRKLLRRATDIEHYWRRGGLQPSSSSSSSLLSSPEHADDSEQCSNQHRTYLCRLEELTPADPLVARAFPLQDRSADETAVHFRFSNFFIADFTAADRGVLANGFYMEGQPASAVRVWSFPEHRVVFEDVLRPEDDDLQEHLLEVGWLAKLMVTTTATWEGAWKALRIYDISVQPKRLLSVFQLEQELSGRQVYILPSWHQRRANVDIQPEVMVVGIERTRQERGIMLRHCVTTGRTVTLCLASNTYIAHVDPRFPEIVLTLDRRCYLTVWSTVTGEMLARMQSSSPYRFDRLALSSIADQEASRQSAASTAGAAQQKQQAMRVVISSTHAAGGIPLTHRVEMWDLIVPSIPFAFPDRDHAAPIANDAHANDEARGQSESSPLRFLQRHGPYPGRLYYLRAIGHLLFGVNYSYDVENAAYKNSLIAYNLDTGEPVYRTDIDRYSRNMAQLDRELLVVTQRELYALCPAAANPAPPATATATAVTSLQEDRTSRATTITPCTKWWQWLRPRPRPRRSPRRPLPPPVAAAAAAAPPLRRSPQTHLAAPLGSPPPPPRRSPPHPQPPALRRPATAAAAPSPC